MGDDMKRKALLVSMAMLTGMPGWAFAKGAGKVQEPEARHWQMNEEDNAFGETPQGVARIALRATEMLAQVKEMVRQDLLDARVANAAPDIHASGWKIELMGMGAAEEPAQQPAPHSQGDARAEATKAVGLALRFKF